MTREASIHAEAQLEALRSMLGRSAMKRAILGLVVEGMQRKQIARLLKRSQHTIDGHLKQLYQQLGIGDRAILVRLAIELEHRTPPSNGGSRK